MKFKPILGSDLSGHIGGVVASHNTYGPYFRQRVRPVNKKTAAQRSQRAAIATIAQTWRLLDPTVQAAWSAATVVKTSRKGDRVNLSGQAAFQFVNTLRQRAGISLLNAPPSTTVGVPTFTLPLVTLTSATAADLVFGPDTWNAPNGAVILSAALLTSTGKAFATPSLAMGILVNPGTDAVSVPLPFAVPIGARIRIQFHATRPDGTQTTYETVDATNPGFLPPTPILLNVVSVTAIPGNQAEWVFDAPITAVNETLLLVEGVGGTSHVITGTNSAAIVYTAAPATGNAWSLTASGATTPPQAAYQAGTVL